ncbi:deoxyribose-phosphate aldolase [Kosmotoga sp.]|uniref:deoxyribose-phosphate aldolase n=1 Tax=Kosmotoga sp. TaxID=1955248 RepID=UPI0024AA78B9|nr:deoxyribose-phosphate aldolase [Kosmotoga sp.]MDI3523809.1 deoxyribose-phosphate aldolase [Kosmotoga sp.]MDK2953353.1 deoxyribose-phosphate aldolase [Kosmotoga sp.]
MDKFMLEKTIKEVIERVNQSYEPINRKLSGELNLARYIDHTLLKPDATPEMIKTLCMEARENNFFSVCVNSCHLPLVTKLLEGTDVARAVVIGFPLGAVPTDVKVYETEWSLNHGADEFDMVINIGYLKAGLYDLVFEDIAKVVKAAKDKVVKVIIETALLTEAEKIAACVIAKEAGAAFVKTSTGFSSGGATAEDVSLMKFVVGDNVKVKASGGMRTREDMIRMLIAGADRIGTSSGMKIIGKK